MTIVIMFSLYENSFVFWKQFKFSTENEKNKSYKLVSHWKWSLYQKYVWGYVEIKDDGYVDNFFPS